MFYLLAILATSRFDYRCEANRTHAAPIDGMKLKYIQVLTRHGQRTPIQVFLDKSNRGQWECDGESAIATRCYSSPARRYRYITKKFDQRYVDYLPNCRPGDLTIYGQNQHVKLGNMYRDYLVNELHFLPSKLDPRLVKLVSSSVDRSFRSAESFLMGFYPPTDVNEVLDMETGSATTSSMIISGGNCKDVEQAINKFHESDEYKAILDKYYPTLKESLDALQLDKSYHGFDSLCGWVIAFVCNDTIRTPSFITDEVIDVCNKVQAVHQYNTFASAKSPGLVISYTMRHMLKLADDFLVGKSPKKFALLSAHDTTLAALLTLLGYKDEIIPPYASHIAMEIWEDVDREKYVRFVFNGKPVQIASLNNDVIKYDDFRTYVQPLIDYCYEIEV